MELFEHGFHPAFSIEDGSVLLEEGSIYEIFFRGSNSRSFMVTDGSNKRIFNNNNLLFLKFEPLLPVEYGDVFGISGNKTRFYFLFEEKVVFFETTNRFKDSQSPDSYMIFFKKVI